jgi:hypothetical protein
MTLDFRVIVRSLELFTAFNYRYKSFGRLVF